MTDNIYTFRGYELECYAQPNNKYWGICRELGISVREDSFELLTKKFREEVEKMKYSIYLSWESGEEYPCTDGEQYSVENLLESLPELVEKIEKIESRNTILNIQISRL